MGEQEQDEDRHIDWQSLLQRVSGSSMFEETPAQVLGEQPRTVADAVAPFVSKEMQATWGPPNAGWILERPVSPSLHQQNEIEKERLYQKQQELQRQQQLQLQQQQQQQQQLLLLQQQQHNAYYYYQQQQQFYYQQQQQMMVMPPVMMSPPGSSTTSCRGRSLISRCDRGR